MARAICESVARYAYLHLVGSAALSRTLGKLDVPAPIIETVAQLNFTLLPITGAHAEHAGLLPPHHGDPFDRLLIAQAMLKGMVFGTQDAMARPYGVPTLGLAQ